MADAATLDEDVARITSEQMDDGSLKLEFSRALPYDKVVPSLQQAGLLLPEYEVVNLRRGVFLCRQRGSESQQESSDNSGVTVNLEVELIRANPASASPAKARYATANGYVVLNTKIGAELPRAIPSHATYSIIVALAQRQHIELYKHTHSEFQIDHPTPTAMSAARALGGEIVGFCARHPDTLKEAAGYVADAQRLLGEREYFSERIVGASHLDATARRVGVKVDVGLSNIVAPFDRRIGGLLRQAEESIGPLRDDFPRVGSMYRILGQKVLERPQYELF